MQRNKAIYEQSVSFFGHRKNLILYTQQRRKDAFSRYYPIQHEIGHAIGYPHQHHSQNDVMSDSLKNVY